MQTEDTSLAAIETIALATVNDMPEPFCWAVFEVALQVVDWPRADLLTELGIEDPLELTGLYEGIPLPEKSLMDPALSPDVVWLFREPILAELREREGATLQELVSHITIHEIAHHFGWSDAQIAAIAPWQT